MSRKLEVFKGKGRSVSLTTIAELDVAKNGKY
jgi:hypothetical protein